MKGGERKYSEGGKQRDPIGFSVSKQDINNEK
jgi:hypothetical protein